MVAIFLAGGCARLRPMYTSKEDGKGVLVSLATIRTPEFSRIAYEYFMEEMGQRLNALGFQNYNNTVDWYSSKYPVKIACDYTFTLSEARVIVAMDFFGNKKGLLNPWIETIDIGEEIKDASCDLMIKNLLKGLVDDKILVLINNSLHELEQQETV